MSSEHERPPSKYWVRIPTRCGGYNRGMIVVPHCRGSYCIMVAAGQGKSYWGGLGVTSTSQA